jgi:Transcriptional regulator
VDFKQLEYFIQIVNSGSYSEAADQLFVSQSSLSKQILALEKELNISLFDRHKRRIELTKAGQAFLPHARELILEYQNMSADISQFKIIPELKIAAFPVIAQYGVISFITQFRQKYPSVNLTFEEREAAEVNMILSNHSCDCAFMRDNYLDKDHYDMVEIAKDRMVLVLSRNHPLAKRKNVSLSELSNENFIMFDKGTVVHELCIDACHNVGFEPRVFYASFRVDTILGLVASNSGIALIMEKVFDFANNQEVIAIPLIEPIESKIVLVYLKESRLSTTTKLFIKMVQNEIDNR